VSPMLLATTAVLPSDVTATRDGVEADGDVVRVLCPGLHVDRRQRSGTNELRCLVRDFTLIVDSVPLSTLATKAVLPSGVSATPDGAEPTGMSSGCLVRDFTSIVDIIPWRLLTTKAVARHRDGAGTSDRTWDHTHQHARQPEHDKPTTPPEPPHQCTPALAVVISSRWADQINLRRTSALPTEPDISQAEQRDAH
jgi:hypothetical protein